jgi:hypothetical protein
MKANELRIGNFIYNDRNEIFKVNWITEIIESRQSTAIPLTEEWLLKFGFEKLSNGWLRLHICNDWSYLYWDRLAGLELSVNKQGIHFSHIKYVHQLQNLYFALTGEELTYGGNNEQ